MGNSNRPKELSGERRFFVNPNQISDGRVVITGSCARQIHTVLRLRKGDQISVLDGLGNLYVCRLDEVSSREVIAEVTDTCTCDNDPSIKLTLAQGLPKGDKVELVVQKATELGISEMALFASERTVARPSADKIAQRLARWESIAKEASEQCCRATIPTITGVLDYDELLSRVAGFDLALVAWEDESDIMLKDALGEAPAGARILLIVGPEGGLTEREVAAAKQAGAIPVSLGKRILRTETAAIAGCAIILHCIQ
ncbi:MAG: 16S rRNA (uracil(1498)-N(3))-methyltransferase [Armatimonadota bacterium]|nr:16S rRNA (uracil(1498)-N(3))-methyltransferase [Armatimonadota bacterium]